MHVGRHIYCSRLIQAGVSPTIVQRALGHSRITTTQQFYTHLTTESVIENIKGVKITPFIIISILFIIFAALFNKYKSRWKKKWLFTTTMGNQ